MPPRGKRKIENEKDDWDDECARLRQLAQDHNVSVPCRNLARSNHSDLRLTKLCRPADLLQEAGDMWRGGEAAKA